MSGLQSRFILYADTETEAEATNRPTVYEADNYHNFIEEMLQDDAWMNKISFEKRHSMLVARDVLCFTLGHDNNQNFAANMDLWAREFKEHLDIQDSFDN